MAACPICQKPSTDKYRPFCSNRCSEIDLGRWLKESYAIPAEQTVPEPIKDEEAE